MPCQGGFIPRQGVAAEWEVQSILHPELPYCKHHITVENSSAANGNPLKVHAKALELEKPKRAKEDVPFVLCHR